MTRLSDFIFPTKNPPRVSDGNYRNVIPSIRPPGKFGNIKQHQGSDNHRLSVRGAMYRTLSDADKEFTDMTDLFALAVVKKPYTFTHLTGHPCGEDGDNWSEYASQAALEIDWTADGPTLDRETSTVKFGSSSLKVTNPGTGNRRISLDNISGINCNVPWFSALCFWMRTSSATANDDIIVKVGDDATAHYYQLKIDVSAEFTSLNTWTEIVLPLGQGAPTATALSNDAWDTTGGPAWTDVDNITLEWETASAAGTWYIDGFCLTYAMIINGLPTIRNPPGRPHMITYSLSLEQYMQL